VVKTYSQLYLDARRALLEKEDVQMAGMMARSVLNSVSGKTQEALLADRDLYASEEICRGVDAAVKRLLRDEPLAYVLGEWEFYGLKLYVNEHVLIPRQDTEILVEEVLKELHDGMEVLDMCTGSGCILISLLRYSNRCKGVGVDISEEALQVAQSNAGNLLKSCLDDCSINFVQSDLFENVTGKYEFIVSNPPYIRSDVIPTLMPEVKDHEPMQALDGTADGLYFYRRITGEGREYLKKGGMLYFEIGYDQAADVSNIMAEAGFAEIKVVKDFAGLDRVVYGTWI
jgi:release factor glutamine methyltransferase